MRCGVKTGTSPIWVKRSLTNSAFFMQRLSRKAYKPLPHQCVADNCCLTSEVENTDLQVLVLQLNPIQKFKVSKDTLIN